MVNSISDQRKLLTSDKKFYLKKLGSSVRSGQTPESPGLIRGKPANQEAGNKTTTSTAFRPRENLYMKPCNASTFYNLTPITENPIGAELSSSRRRFGHSKRESTCLPTHETIRMNST